MLYGVVYNRIRAGESVRSITQNMEIDRKNLRKKMGIYLTEEQKNEINEFLKPGRKANPNEAKKMPRGKKKLVNVDKQMGVLVKEGVTPAQIENIFDRLNKSKNTRLTRETFITKLSEIIVLMKKRNENIDEESKGYIKTEDIISLINKNPRIMTMDTNKRLEDTLKFIDDEATMSTEETNRILKENPWILKNGINKLKQGVTILKCFDIRLDQRHSQNLLAYCIENGGRIFQVNTQKLFHRLCYYAAINNSRLINKTQYYNLGKNEFKYGVSNLTDEGLRKMYEFPEHYENLKDFDNKVRKIIDEAIVNRDR